MYRIISCKIQKTIINIKTNKKNKTIKKHMLA